jgi:hypothetical protein
MQTLEIRFAGRLLAARRDRQGVLEQLFYKSDEYFVIHSDVPGGPAWLEDARGDGLIKTAVQRSWPELAEAASLD